MGSEALRGDIAEMGSEAGVVGENGDSLEKIDGVGTN